MTSVLFDSDDIRVLYHPGTEDTVFVSFSEFGQRINGTKFWGDSLFASKNASAIGIVPARPNWYPPSKMQAAIELICTQLEKLPQAKRILYGHSQGGYGALRYGAVLGADAVVAFCPQYSIAAADVGTFDQRYLEHAPNEPMRLAPEHLAGRNYVMADPLHKIDMIHVRTICEMGNVEFIPFPFTGHESVRLVSEASIAWPFLTTIAAEQGRLVAPLRQLVRAHRRDSATYLAHLASTLRNRRRRPDLAIPLFEQVRRQRKNKGADLIGLIQCHLDLKQYDQSSKLLSEITLSAELDQGMLLRLASAYRLVGQIDNAMLAETFLNQKRQLLSKSESPAPTQP
jgi:hypothetical protein